MLVVPTTFETELLDGLAGIPVSAIYGSLPEEHGARAKKWLPAADLVGVEEHIAQARARGIGFYYTLNSSCGANREFTAEGQKWLAQRLGWLADCGAEGVVATNPYVIEMVKRRYPELRVSLSSIVNVDSVDKALFYEDLGVDSIYLAEYLNRDFRLLRTLRRKLRCDLVPIVNLGCLVHCPLRDYHANFVSHSAECLDRGCYLDYSLAKCIQVKSMRPVEMVKAPWIRPEDLSKYEAMGFARFKLAGREKGREWILQAAAAYAARSYRGKLNDLILGFDGVDPFGEFPVGLDNRRLEGFLEFFKNKDCRLGCDGCTHCEEWLERAMVSEGDRRGYGENIDRLLLRFTSGSFKAPPAGGA
ncbi:MAG TPA: U32 family peptidase [candidate division Zixibacteria bacterium]|nr:U32 family peptidase [candidate division Zixibacteria bacterium]